MFPYIDMVDNNGGKNYQISVPGLYKIENGVVKYISATTTDKKNIIALFYKSASADSVYSVNKQSSSLKRGAAGVSSTVKRSYFQDFNSVYFDQNTDLGNGYGVKYYSMKGIKQLDSIFMQDTEYGAYVDYINRYDIFVEFSVDNPAKIPPKSVELIVNRDNLNCGIRGSFYPAYIYKANGKTIYRFAIIGAGMLNLRYESRFSDLTMSVSVKGNPDDPQGKILKDNSGNDVAFIYDAIAFTESYNYLYLNNTTSLGTKNDGSIGELLDGFYKVSKDFGESASQSIKDATIRKYDFTKLHYYIKETLLNSYAFQYMGIDSYSGFGGSHVFLITNWFYDSSGNLFSNYKRINVPYNTFSLIQTLKYSNLPKTVKVSFGAKKDLSQSFSPVDVSIPVDVTMTDNTGLTYMDTDRWFIATDEYGNSKEYRQSYFIPPKSGVYTIVGKGIYNGVEISSSGYKINVADKLTISLSSINTPTNSIKLSFSKGGTPREIKAGTPTEIYLTQKMVSDTGGFYGVKIESPATSNMVISGNIYLNNQKVCNLANAKVKAGMVLWAKDLSDFTFKLDVNSVEKQVINSVPTYTFYRNISDSIPVTLSATNSLMEELYIDLANVNYNCFSNSWQKVNIDYNNVNSLLSAGYGKYYLSYIYSNGYIPYSDGYSSVSKKYNSGTVNIMLQDVAKIELYEDKLPVIQNSFKVYDFNPNTATSFRTVIRNSDGEVINNPNIEKMKIMEYAAKETPAINDIWKYPLLEFKPTTVTPGFYSLRCRVEKNGKKLATSNAIAIHAVRKPVSLILTEENGKQIKESDGTIIFPEDSKLVMKVVADDGNSYGIENYLITPIPPASIIFSQVGNKIIKNYEIKTMTSFDDTAGKITVLFDEFNNKSMEIRVKVQERIPKITKFTANPNTILANNSDIIKFETTIKDQFGDDYKGSVEYIVKGGKGTFELASDSFKTFEPGDYTVTARVGGVEFEEKKINVTVNKREPQIKSITASKQTILANGNDFTRLDAVVVDQNGQEMPAMVKFYDDGKEINGNEFNTKISGSHAITASVVDGSSNVIKRDGNNEIVINAEPNIKDMLLYKIENVYKSYSDTKELKFIIDNYEAIKKVSDMANAYNKYKKWFPLMDAKKCVTDDIKNINKASWENDYTDNYKDANWVKFDKMVSGYTKRWIEFNQQTNKQPDGTVKGYSYSYKCIKDFVGYDGILSNYLSKSYYLTWNGANCYTLPYLFNLVNVGYTYDETFAEMYKNDKFADFDNLQSTYQMMKDDYPKIVDDNKNAIIAYLELFDIKIQESDLDYYKDLARSCDEITKRYNEIKVNSDYKNVIQDAELLYSILNDICAKDDYYIGNMGFKTDKNGLLWSNEISRIENSSTVESRNTINSTSLKNLYDKYKNSGSLTITADGTELTLGIPYVEGATKYEIQRTAKTNSAVELRGTTTIPLYFDFGKPVESYTCTAYDSSGKKIGVSTANELKLESAKTVDPEELSLLEQAFKSIKEPTLKDNFL